MGVLSVGLGLDGSAAFVTGGSTGIGRATAMALAKEGARVVIADINESDAATVVADVRESGGGAVFVRTDVSAPDQVEAAVAAAVKAFGGIDCAVNCAAVTLKSARVPTAEVDIEVFDRIIAVDLRGTFLSMKYELRQMVLQGYGSIVNVSSGSGLVAQKNNPSYIAAKHGVIGLSRAAALDYAERAIRVNAVVPGLTKTPMIADIPPEYLKDTEIGIPLQRAAEPYEIANAIVWLCSPLSSYATGSALVVDGGFTAQ
jgi:NAD(P)-dependent dehydrogenase (short-subunit alcohol dehydrogenase family)